MCYTAHTYMPGQPEQKTAPGKAYQARLVLLPPIFDKKKLLNQIPPAREQITGAFNSLTEQKPQPLPEKLAQLFQDKYAKVGHILNVIEALTRVDPNDPQNDFKDFFTQALNPLAQAYGFQ